jgi:5-(carboxyamino)imidazole ribonucleotide synthase
MATRIGIIGGGQLGLFLGRAARDLGLEAIIMAGDPDAPAATWASEFITGATDDVDAVRQLVELSDVITFEIETVSDDVMACLVDAENHGQVVVRPSVDVLRTIKNKAVQKNWMRDHELPTLPFEVLDDGEADFAALTAKLGPVLVQKAQQGGYDGRGVQRVENADQLWPIPSLVEPCLAQRREIAILIARGIDGETRCYEPVSMAFNTEQHILEEVHAPAEIPATVAERAHEIAERTVTALDGVGIFSIEMFVTEEDEVLINEISPRVHNAGHYTLEACPTSQFEQHLRAVAGLPLGPVDQQRAAVMRNLLAAPGAPVGTRQAISVTPAPDAYLHWYGKREAKPWRKMGHLTCLHDTTEEAARLARQVTGRLDDYTQDAA